MKLKATVVELLLVILGDKKRELPGYLPRVINDVPHLRNCRIGEAVDGYHGPNYAPCSPLCVRIREACDRALDALRVPAIPEEARPAGRAARGGVPPMSRRARARPGKVLPSAPARRRSS